MDTQNTPIHVNLWHHEFWLMGIANLLLTTCIYILIPIFAEDMIRNGFSFEEVAIAMGVYGLGIFAFGGFTNYLIQRFRRNNVCVFSIIGVIACLAAGYYFTQLPRHTDFLLLVLVRFLMGAFFGLSQMVLNSTLIIDISESFKRTEACYATAWFGRFALAIGPFLSVFVSVKAGVQMVFVVAIICALVSICLIKIVNFPFKAPSENLKKYSNDRFFLVRGWPLFVNLIMITTVIGLLFTVTRFVNVCGMMMAGFLLAVIAEKWAFQNADLKSEIVSGLICIGIAIILMITRHQEVVHFLAPSLVGFGIGIIGSRFLLFFIKLANHCQRGTSSSTFFLGWELGISIGLFIGYIVHNEFSILLVCLSLMAISLANYHFVVHPWYMKNRNR